jgi:hypothetical protein
MFSTVFRKTLIPNFTQQSVPWESRRYMRADGHTSNRRFSRIKEFGNSGSRYKNDKHKRVTTEDKSMKARGAKVYEGMEAMGSIMYEGTWAIGRTVHEGGEVAGTCECSNEPSGSIKCGEFLD